VKLKISGLSGIPTTGVSAVVLNVTVSACTATSNLTVYADGTSRPAMANLHWVKGQTVANQVVVPVVNGWIDPHNSTGDTQIGVDLTGYYTS
jgi:hypothetical protein